MTESEPLPPFSSHLVTDLSDPYPVYEPYRRLDPVHQGSPPGTWYVFDHAGSRTVLRSRDFQRSAPSSPGPTSRENTVTTLVRDWLVFMDPPRHTDLRALFTRQFTPDLVEGLRPRIRQITQNLAAEMVRNPAPDLVSDFAAPLPLLVISELLGVPSDMRAWFREQAANLQEASTSRAERAPGGQARSESAARALIAYFSAETERPGRKDREDLIGLLLRAEEKDQGLTRPVVIANCIHLLSAGHETTTGLIGKAFLALMRAPEQADLLRAEPELLPGAVEEFLRYDPPVQMVSRWAIKDTPVGERVIPRGAKTVVVLGSANRDERHFTSPDMLNLRRDARGHQAFGFGPHFCLGSRLAVAEAEIAIGELLHLAPRLHTSLPIRYEDDLVFHGPRSIPVFFAE